LLGDCLHNFRCTLDHLAFAVVSKHGKPHDGTQFPIISAPSRFQGAYNSRINIPTPRRIQAAFERAQPYKGRSRLAALWTLHRLDIIDKHRELLTINMPLEPSIQISGPLTGMYQVDRGPFHDPADVLHLRIPFGPDGPVEVHVKPSFEIQIPGVELTPGRPVSLPLRETLNDIRSAVRLVMTMLEEFCD
jgi:hypothetical protein